MAHDDRGKEEQLEEHSLPGTNQAGKGADSQEENSQEHRPDGAEAQSADELAHSLPGTNQAGKRLTHVKNPPE